MINKHKIQEFAKQGLSRNGFFNKAEFKREIRNLFTIRTQVSRFLDNKAINEKLLINNVLIAVNYFSILKANLLLKLVADDINHWSVIKTILLFLSSFNYPEDRTEINYSMNNLLIEQQSEFIRREHPYQ